MDLGGKVAVITGGTRGIGRQIAGKFVEHGASVVVTGRGRDAGERAEKELGVHGPALYVEGDVTSRSDAERMVDSAIGAYGRLDVLVNNAGGGAAFAPLAEMTDDAWHDTIALNLHSVFYATRRALSYLVPQGSGRIITISSMEGKHADPGMGPYAAAKHAVIGLMRSLAREVGPSGVTANCVCPGMVFTDLLRSQGGAIAAAMGMTFDQLVTVFTERSAIRRATTADEVAMATVFLASDAAAAVTGSAWSVDGGVTCC